MGYYMRFLQTDHQPVTIECIATALCERDSAYGMVDGGNLTYDGEALAQITIDRQGDGLFEAEIRELRQDVEEAKGHGKKRVLETLDSAKAIIAVQVLLQDRDVEETMSLIDPLWLWLFRNRPGLVQADGEGYYTRLRCILAVE